jgi:hypothetical protein
MRIAIALTTSAMDEGGKRPDRLDVDAIWQQLNASQPANKQSFARLWHGFNSDVSRPYKPCSSSTQDTDKKKAQQLKLDPFIGRLEAARNRAKTASEQPAAPPAASLEGAAVDRLVQALQSPDASVRKAALHQVQVIHAQPKTCASSLNSSSLSAKQCCANLQHQKRQVHILCITWYAGVLKVTSKHLAVLHLTLQAAFVNSTPPPSAEAVAEALSCKLGKALLRRFEDKSEACREAAVSTFKAMLQVLDSSCSSIVNCFASICHACVCVC